MWKDNKQKIIYVAFIVQKPILNRTSQNTNMYIHQSIPRILANFHKLNLMVTIVQWQTFEAPSVTVGHWNTFVEGKHLISTVVCPKCLQLGIFYSNTLSGEKQSSCVSSTVIRSNIYTSIVLLSELVRLLHQEEKVGRWGWWYIYLIMVQPLEDVIITRLIPNGSMTSSGNWFVFGDGILPGELGWGSFIKKIGLTIELHRPKQDVCLHVSFVL